MKFAWIALCAALLVGCAGAPPPPLESLLAHDAEGRVQVCALVVDLDSGEVLLSQGAARLCRPASTMKLLTTSSVCRRALDRPFRTRVVHSGDADGQLALIGDGDPFLTVEDVQHLARTLRAQGVRSVTGPVRVVDPLCFAPRWGQGWMWDDEPSSYQPVISGAAVDRGCVTVVVSGRGRALAAELQPVAGALELRVEDVGGTLRITRGRYQDAGVVTVVGELPDGAPTERRVSVPDPARYAGHVLLAALADAGVAVRAPGVEVVGPLEVPAGVEASRERAVADVVVETNKVSDNLGAELLLRRLARVSELHPVELGVESEAIGKLTVAADLEALGVDPGGFRLADGSGVSHYNLVSADLLVRVLVDMHERGGAQAELFRRSLPIAGRDGTLAKRMKGTAAEGRVFAKTGTISAVSNLAGYVDTRSGRRLAFAVLCQNYVGAAAPWRALQDRFCARLAGL